LSCKREYPQVSTIVETHASVLDLAEILGINEYIAKIIIRAIKEEVAKDPQYSGDT
jgi:hypothetical protein